MADSLFHHPWANTARFELPQPAVSQHLRVLRDAGLVHVRRDAQRRFYSINPDGMRVIEVWLERHRRAVADKLDDLDRYLDEREDCER
jgi:DNA-binding transcriptional ArsR family regulator